MGVSIPTQPCLLQTTGRKFLAIHRRHASRRWYGSPPGRTKGGGRTGRQSAEATDRRVCKTNSVRSDCFPDGRAIDSGVSTSNYENRIEQNALGTRG